MARINWATVALGASASASSTYNPGGNPYDPSNIIDENDGTAWVSNVNSVNGQWGRVDLGQARLVTAYRIYTTAYVVTFDIQSSPDNSVWTTQVSGSGPSESGVVPLATPVTARYWRVLYTSGVSGNQLNTLELLVYNFTADAATMKTQAGSLTANAIIDGPHFTVDARIAGDITGSFTANAAIKRTQATSLTADAIQKWTTRPGYRATILADTPRFWLRLEEPSGAFLDSSGNGTTITFAGTPTRGVLGPLIEGDVGITTTSSLTAAYTVSGQVALSAELWFRTTATGFVRFFQNRGSGGRALQFGIGAGGFGSAAGQLNAYVNSDGIWIGTHSNATYNDGNWHHAVATWAAASGSAVSPSSFKIYVDGVQVAVTADSVAGSTTSPFTGNGNMAMNDAGGGSTSFDEIAYYQRELTAGQILTHYRAGTILPLNLTANAIRGKTTTGTFTVNSVLIPMFFLVNAVKLRTITPTFTANAAIYPLRFPMNAVIFRLDRPGSFTANAVIKRTNQSGSSPFTADAIRMKPTQIGYREAVLRDLPQFWLRLEELAGSFLDSSGNGRTVTTTGTPTRGVLGPLLEGDVGITTTSGSSLTVTYTVTGHTASSMELWFKTNTTGYARFTQNRGSGAGRALQFGIGPSGFASSAGRLSAYVNSNSLWIGIYTTATYNDNVWHHAVATWATPSGAAVTTAHFKIYVDGVQVATVADTVTGSTTSPFTGNGNMTLVDGGVPLTSDELAYYRQELTAGAVAAHYAAGVVVGLNFKADAAKFKELSGSFTANAIRRIEVTGSFTAGADISPEGERRGIFTVDATVAITTTGSFTADSWLVGGGSITVDAAVGKTTTGSIPTDAALFRAQSNTFLASAVIKISGIAGSFTADAHYNLRFYGDLTADATVLRVGTGSFTINYATWSGVGPPPPILGVPTRIFVDGVEVTSHVVWRTAEFTAKVNAGTGTCSLDLVDRDHDLGFTFGQEITLYIDGILRWGGYLLQATRSFPFPVLAQPTTDARTWHLEGVDYNRILDRRVLHDTGSPNRTWSYPAGTYDDVIFDDIWPYFDTTGFTKDIHRVGYGVLDIPGVTSRTGGNVAQGGFSIRDVLMHLSWDTGAIYYVTPEKVVTYVDADLVTSAYTLTDTPSGPFDVGFHDVQILEDSTDMVNDAIVWGAGKGSANVVNARYESDAGVTAHGRWQAGNFTSGIYKQLTANAVATARVEGSPVSHRGAKNPKRAITLLTWEPVFGVGDVVNFHDSQFLLPPPSPDEAPTHDDVLPIRTMKVTWPTPLYPLFDLQLSWEVDAVWSFYDPWLPINPVDTGNNPPLDDGGGGTEDPPPEPGGCDPDDCGITDSFSRTMNSLWGTSDAGYPWFTFIPTNTAASVADGVGYLVAGASGPGGDTQMYVRLDGFPFDGSFDMVMKFRFKVPAGADPAYVTPRLTMVWGGSGNYYDIYVYPADDVMYLETGGGITDAIVASPLPYGDSGWMWMRWEAVFSLYNRIKFWNDGDAEPETWNATQSTVGMDAFEPVDNRLQILVDNQTFGAYESVPIEMWVDSLDIQSSSAGEVLSTHYYADRLVNESYRVSNVSGPAGTTNMPGSVWASTPERIRVFLTHTAPVGALSARLVTRMWSYQLSPTPSTLTWGVYAGSTWGTVGSDPATFTDVSALVASGSLAVGSAVQNTPWSAPELDNVSAILPIVDGKVRFVIDAASSPGSGSAILYPATQSDIDAHSLTQYYALEWLGAGGSSDANRCTAVWFDDFERTITGAWGYSTSGYLWSNVGSSAPVAVSGGFGTLAVTNTFTFCQMRSPSLTDIASGDRTMTAQIKFSSVTLGGNAFAATRLAQIDDIGNGTLSVNSPYVLLEARAVAGAGRPVGTNLVMFDHDGVSSYVPVSISINTLYTLKWEMNNETGSYAVKFYPTSMPEPSLWAIQTSVTPFSANPPQLNIQAVWASTGSGTTSFGSIDFDYDGRPCFPCGESSRGVWADTFNRTTSSTTSGFGAGFGLSDEGQTWTQFGPGGTDTGGVVAYCDGTTARFNSTSAISTPGGGVIDAMRASALTDVQGGWTNDHWLFETRFYIRPASLAATTMPNATIGFNSSYFNGFLITLRYHADQDVATPQTLGLYGSPNQNIVYEDIDFSGGDGWYLLKWEFEGSSASSAPAEVTGFTRAKCWPEGSTEPDWQLQKQGVNSGWDFVSTYPPYSFYYQPSFGGINPYFYIGHNMNRDRFVFGDRLGFISPPLSPLAQVDYVKYTPLDCTVPGPGGGGYTVPSGTHLVERLAALGTPVAGFYPTGSEWQATNSYLLTPQLMIDTVIQYGNWDTTDPDNGIITINIAVDEDSIVTLNYITNGPIV